MEVSQWWHCPRYADIPNWADAVEEVAQIVGDILPWQHTESLPQGFYLEWPGAEWASRYPKGTGFICP